MSNLFKICMFFTSFLPLWISIIFIDTSNIFEGNKNLRVEYATIIFVLAAFIFSVIVVFSCLKRAKTGTKEPFILMAATREKGITSEYLLSYILPLFAFDFTLFKSMLLFLLYFLTLAFLCVRNDNVYANLILEFRKYSFFSCEIKYAVNNGIENKHKQVMIISKSNLVAKNNELINISSLNKPFYLHYERSNSLDEVTS